MKTDDNSAKVGFPPPLVYLGILLIGLVVDRIVGFAGIGLPLPLQFLLAAATVGPGIALILLAIFGFRAAATPSEPWREVTAFVTTSIFRFTRNPMYLGMAGIYTGLALAINSVAALLLLPVVIVVIRTQVIAREEAYMAQRFGMPYIDYCKQVRRWL